MSAVTRLRVGDEAFLVAAMIERCPKSMMIRELLQNALEAAGNAPEGQRRVEFSALTLAGSRKLAIWNAGRGLTADELYRMCDIAASINKETGLDANFGMGAKVASLPSNQHGLRYRSCRDGTVHEVILGKRDGIYGRIRQPGPDGRPTEVIEATAAAQAEGRDTRQDWTEVVLLGNRPDQDTVADPYDGHPSSPGNWLTESIAGRFLRFPSGIDVTLLPGVRPGTPRSHTLRGAERRIVALRHHERVTLRNGIAIHYAYDPPDPDRPARNLSQASGPENAEGLAAVAYRGEMYSMLRGAHWRREAPSFGIATGARHVSVVIELPASFPVQIEGYREFLRYRGDLQRPLRLLDFAAMAAENQPDWLKDILASNSPSASLVIDARFAMEALLRELGVTRLRRARAVPAALAEAAAPPAESTPAPAGKAAAQPPPAQRVDDPKAPPQPVFETAPEIFLLREPAEIADVGLTHRAACYYPESHQLHVNLAYPAVGSFARMLAGVEEDGEPIAPAAVDVAERFTVMRVGRALVHALAKRGRPREWNEAQLRAVLSPESLTLAADDVHAGLTDAREAYRQAVTITADDA
ncbi:ATP-binding protein [Roseomonas sp. HJA6]|uniref:ATP-binding protein n=1 Tax=Roseomonas alba TaxID=2846776 RepID=A0ABS7AGJ6_9PROT|nr:ATP-binding protein [Neoroseomonas alba]MBW6400294.1 ATP-binding protein [Neoroseomonas alba]